MPWLFSPQNIKIPTMEKHMNKDQLKLLGAKIKEVRRQETDLSQEQLALVANLDRSFISRLERGVANPSYLKLLQIATALKKPLKEILPD